MKTVRVRYRKLGRHASKDEGRIYGLAWGHIENGTWKSSGLIEVDPRQSEKELMDTLTHEVLHMELPDIAEESVDRAAGAITAILRKAGFGMVK